MNVDGLWTMWRVGEKLTLEYLVGTFEHFGSRFKFQSRTTCESFRRWLESWSSLNSTKTGRKMHGLVKPNFHIIISLKERSLIFHWFIISKTLWCTTKVPFACGDFVAYFNVLAFIRVGSEKVFFVLWHLSGPFWSAAISQVSLRAGHTKKGLM